MINITSIKRIDLDRLAISSTSAKNKDFIPQNSLNKQYWNNVNNEVDIVKFDEESYRIQSDGVTMAYTDKKGYIYTKLDNINKNEYITLDLSNAKQIPMSVIEKYTGENTLPRILLTDENGKVISCSGDTNSMGETGSVAKIFTALAACELLDPNQEIVISEYAIQKAGEFDSFNYKPGDKITVKEAITSGFPLSNNVAAFSLAIELGRKYNDSNLKDEDACSKGLDVINTFLYKKGFKTNLSDPAGFNTGADYDNNNYGLSKSQEFGSCSSDIINCLMLLYKNDVYKSSLKAKVNNNESFKTAMRGHEEVANEMDNCNIKPASQLFEENAQDGLYFNKSGTQYYNSGTYVIQSNGKKYYLSIQGIRTMDDGGNYIKVANAVYEHYFKNNN